MDYSYFSKLGLDESYANIYMTLYKLGTQPASVIAKTIGTERTKIYRKLLNMVKMGIIKETQKHKVKHFFIDNVRALGRLIEKKNKEIEYINQNQDIFFSTIEQSKISDLNAPKVTLYEAGEGVNNIFEDILSTIKSKGIITIRIFASNTIEERDEGGKIGEYADKFFKDLEKENIHIDEYIGVGNLIMERIEHYIDSSNLSELPAAKSSVNIILVGSILYFVVYDNAPMGIKIENDNLSDAMHILFDEIRKLKEIIKKGSQKN